MGDEALPACPTGLICRKEATLRKPEQQAQERSKQGTPLTIATSQILLDKQISTSCELCGKLLLLTVNVLELINEQA